MAFIKLKPDTLDEETRRFAPAPLTDPVFLNSIPKSGSHLLRNILRMFVPVEQQYRAQFIQWPNLQQHLTAFDPARNYLSFGHLFFADASAIELSHVRKILLYRDPYGWVLAQARFFLSDEFQNNVDHIKGGRLSVDDLLSLMIFGIPQKNPSLRDMYELNVAAWLGSSSVHPVKFEELRSHANALDAAGAASYFEELLAACGIAPLPPRLARAGSGRLRSPPKLDGSRESVRHFGQAPGRAAREAPPARRLRKPRASAAARLCLIGRNVAHHVEFA